MYSNGNLEWLDKRQSQQTAQSPSSRLRERRRERAKERRKGWHMPPTQSRAHLLACCWLEMNYHTSTFLSLWHGKMQIRAWCCKLDAYIYIYICPSFRVLFMAHPGPGFLLLILVTAAKKNASKSLMDLGAAFVWSMYLPLSRTSTETWVKRENLSKTERKKGM